jgi:hypothetical protein
MHQEKENHSETRSYSSILGMRTAGRRIRVMEEWLLFCFIGKKIHQQLLEIFSFDAALSG